MLLPAAGPLRYADHVAREGEAFYEEVGDARPRRASSPSAPTRRTSAGARPHWLKLARGHAPATSWSSASRGRRAGGRASARCTSAPTRASGCVYVGRVGSGFGDQQLADAAEAARRARAPKSRVCEGRCPRGASTSGSSPSSSARSATRSGPRRACCGSRCSCASARTRTPRECLRRGRRRAARAGPPLEPPRATPEPAGRAGALHEPRQGVLARGELHQGRPHRATTGPSSPWLLPYLRDRPLVLTRYPDGIEGKSFFQKDAPDFVPDWMRTEPRVERAHRPRHRLLRLRRRRDAALPRQPGHDPAARLVEPRRRRSQRPDWCILDLDPKGAPFAHVVELALRDPARSATRSGCRAAQDERRRPACTC